MVHSTIPQRQAQVATHRLNRETFTTSRQLDFFSEKELTKQTGCERHLWAQVIIKDLVDTALDAAEESGVVPVVQTPADATGISVQDNGPGLPASTLKGAMDFSVRVSSREAYV